MRVASVASSHSKKLMKFTLSIFSPRFSSSRCKTAAKMAVARIKLLRNKRQAVVRQMRRDIALLLQSGQDATARVRVEHAIREQNVLAANEFIELFCELIVARLTIIAKQRECPADLKEGIASLIFAAPRCAEIPELAAIVKIFEKKYGRDFVSAATDLRPNCGVNRILIDKLSVRTPSGEAKLKVMKEIAKEHQIDWDTAESEKELLKPPEERIEGPDNFVSASSFPVKVAESKPIIRPTNEGTMGNGQFQDTASAAEAAAESAKQAIAAAQAAAHLANKHFVPLNQAPGFDHLSNSSSINPGFEVHPGNSRGQPVQNRTHINYQVADHRSDGFKRSIEPHNFDRSYHVSNEESKSAQMDNETMYRRQSNNGSSGNSEIKFDESDSDEEDDIEMEEAPPPKRPPPPVPSSKADPVHQVHPKLPDYDSLAARFEALKYHKSQT